MRRPLHPPNEDEGAQATRMQSSGKKNNITTKHTRPAAPPGLAPGAGTISSCGEIAKLLRIIVVVVVVVVEITIIIIIVIITMIVVIMIIIIVVIMMMIILLIIVMIMIIVMIISRVPWCKLHSS